jgi:hypothetical protein
LSKGNFVEFGIESKYHFSSYNFFQSDYTNALGDSVPALYVDDDINSPKAGAFASLTLTPMDRLRTTAGVRYDYFDFNQHSHFSPRLSLTWKLSDITSLNAATGIFYQNLPLNILAQKVSNKELKDPVSYHAILGMSRLLNENTKLTLETYYKSYKYFPLDPAQPQFFVADYVASEGYAGNYDRLLDKGKARSYGIEATVQKKLVSGIYGLACASYSKSEYKSIDGIWRDRIFDNGLIFGVEGGIKPNNKWEFSTRWIYAGGRPYTPLDIDASRAINRSILDGTRVNDARYPAYHSLNIRADRRFLFKGSNLIAYFSIWNVYNQKNIADVYWDEINRKQGTVYQWSMLPVFGFEYEF